ncbi:hypothetical protein ACSX1A_10990 [Pontibacter sp. MBLB2868]|uniref:hypothetical protein n=1 Tax=Pontibacter sp. MBLB2868 TaxID=3451555 RepID=UPI003F754900
METPPFFSAQDFRTFAKFANVTYDKTSPTHLKVREELKAGAWSKTGYWVRELAGKLPGYKFDFTMAWQQRSRQGKHTVSTFKPYTWGRLYIADAPTKDVYFTVGLNPVEGNLILKLDYQREGNSELTNSQKRLCELHLYTPNGTRRYTSPIPLNQLSQYDWSSLLKASVTFIKAHEDRYKELLDQLSSVQEQRIARVAWNSNGWIAPSGPKGKSKEKSSHEYKQGFGHEEWLFDTSKLVDGYHYAFLEPVRRQHAAFEGNKYDVMLYSLDGDSKKRYWIGEVKQVEVISPAEAERIQAIYSTKGWLLEMKKQIADVGGKSNNLSNWRNVNFFNIRFKPQDLRVYPDLIEIPGNNSAIKRDRYVFLKAGHDFDQPTELEGFTFQPAPKRLNGNNTTYQTGYTRQAKTIELELFHKKISDALCASLQKVYGKSNVHPEHPSGIGSNRIDIVVKDGKECIFYEIKTHNALRVCIREAFGQVMEYGFYTNSINAKELIIVSHHAADAATTLYLQHLRKQFGLPLYYQQYDLEMQALQQKV